MKMLSTGDPSTLGSYMKMTKLLMGEKAVAFLQEKIDGSPDGEDEMVIAEETQVIQLLAAIDRGDR